MASPQEAVDRVLDYLADQTPLETFEDWSASFASEAYKSGDQQAKELAGMIRSILNAYVDDETEEALRSELREAIVPFQLHENYMGTNLPRSLLQGELATMHWDAAA